MLYIDVDVDIDIGKYLNHRPRLYNISFNPKVFLKRNTTETGPILPCIGLPPTPQVIVCVCFN